MDNITLRSKNKLNNAKNNEDLIVQVLDWYTTEEERDGSDSDSDSENKYKPVIYDYIIMLFCNDINGNSISIKIDGFKPYFYIKVPKNGCDLMLKIL